MIFLQVNCLQILCILSIWEATTGAPVVAIANLGINSKVDDHEVTTYNKDLLEQIGCDLSPPAGSQLKADAITTVALFYVGQNNFIFIAIDPFDAKYFGNFISYTSKEFNRTKIYEAHQTDEDYAGLVKVFKVNDKRILNLEGIAPDNEESE